MLSLFRRDVKRQVHTMSVHISTIVHILESHGLARFGSGIAQNARPGADRQGASSNSPDFRGSHERQAPHAHMRCGRIDDGLQARILGIAPSPATGEQAMTTSPVLVLDGVFTRARRRRSS